MCVTSMPAIRIRTQRKVLKPNIWPGDAFDGAGVLLDEVVEVLRRAHLDGSPLSAWMLTMAAVLAPLKAQSVSSARFAAVGRLLRSYMDSLLSG